MKGKILKDWSRVDFNNPADRKKIYGAVNHFMQADQRPEVKAAIQHFANGDDFPTSVLEILEKFHLTDNFDSAWENLFAIRDYTGSNRNGFELADVGSGIAIVEVPIGSKAKLAKMAGAKTTVNFAMYGGGLQWHRTLIDDKDFWTLEDNAIEFRNEAYRVKAATFYTLIEALGSGQNTAWQAVTGSVATTDPNYVAIRDMNTINSACLSILTDCKDKGYGIGVGTQFNIVAPLALQPRISRALGLLNAGISGSLAGVPYTVRPSYTMGFAAQTSYYIGVKGIKNIVGNRMNLQVFDKFDPESYSDLAVGWMRFGGAIGDTQLIRRCAVS